MKYYEIFTKDHDIDSKQNYLAMTIVDEDKAFGTRHRGHAFVTDRMSPNEPIEIQAHYFKEENLIEEDLVSAGFPCIVSEAFRRLVEDFDAGAAQFFETTSINCTTEKKYYVMHIIKTIHCLDKDKSKIINYPPEAEMKPSIAVGRVDASKISERDYIFRLGESVQMHYVSEKLYKEFRKRKLSGCDFVLR